MAKYDERIDDLSVTVIDKWAGDGIASQCGIVFLDETGRELTWMTDHVQFERMYPQRGMRFLISGLRYGDRVKRVRYRCQTV